MASRLIILFRLRTLGFEGRGTWEQGSSFAVSLVSSHSRVCVCVCVCWSIMAHSERVYPVGLFRVALVVITSALFTGKLIFHSYQRCSSDLLNLLKSA